MERGRRYVSWGADGAAHDYYFFRPKEGFGIYGGGASEVGERADGNDADAVGLVFAEEAKHLFVGG